MGACHGCAAEGLGTGVILVSRRGDVAAWSPEACAAAVIAEEGPGIQGVGGPDSDRRWHEGWHEPTCIRIGIASSHDDGHSCCNCSIDGGLNRAEDAAEAKRALAA